MTSDQGFARAGATVARFRGIVERTAHERPATLAALRQRFRICNRAT
jgi:hypothetical protein